MPRHFTLLLLTAIFALRASPALPCECIRVPANSVEYSGLIVVGRIVSLELQSTGTLAVGVTVTEILNGDVPAQRLTLYGHPFGSSCYGIDFRIGREYILFPYRNEDAAPDVLRPAGSYLFGTICGPTVETGTQQGQRILAEIRKYLGKK